MEKDGSQILTDILSGKEEGIVVLYNDYKVQFVHWARSKFRVSDDDALDIFQDAVIGFYRNVKQGKIQNFEYSAKSYLFSIGRHLLLNKVKFEKRFDRDIDALDKVASLIVNPEISLHVRQDVRGVINDVLKDLGEPCYTILKLYYYDHYSLEAVASSIQSKNANVVKAQKCRCLKSLRKMVLDNFREEDFY